MSGSGLSGLLPTIGGWPVILGAFSCALVTLVVAAVSRWAGAASLAAAALAGLAFAGVEAAGHELSPELANQVWLLATPVGLAAALAAGLLVLGLGSGLRRAHPATAATATLLAGLAAATILR